MIYQGRLSPRLSSWRSSAPSEITFTSKKRTWFRLFAKIKDGKFLATDKVYEPKDLYSDLFGPTLLVNLEVEIWLAGEPVEDSDRVHTAQDSQWINQTALGRITLSWRHSSGAAGRPWVPPAAFRLHSNQRGGLRRRSIT